MKNKRKASLISALVMIVIAITAGITLVGREARWVDIITIIGSSVAAGVSFALALQKAKKDKGASEKS